MRQEFPLRCASSLGRRTRRVRPAFLVISGPHFAPLFAPTDLPGEPTVCRRWFLLSFPSTVLASIFISSSLTAANGAPALSRIQNSLFLNIVLFVFVLILIGAHLRHSSIQFMKWNAYCRCGFLPVFFFWVRDFRPGVVGSWAFSHLYCVSWGASFHSPPLPFSFSSPIFEPLFDAPFAVMEVASILQWSCFCAFV